jgi:hypothetical protein
LKVGVAPTTAPEADATVKLWPSGDIFVKSIDTLPALAVSEVLSNFSCPSGLVSRLNARAPLAPAELDAGVGAGVGLVLELAAELEVVACAEPLDGADVEELVVLDELPQPAIASTPRRRATLQTFEMELDLA